MFSGILLATLILSATIIYNDQLKLDNYRGIVGEIPFDTRFHILGENQESYQNLSKVKSTLLQDERTQSATIIASQNSNPNSNGRSLIRVSTNTTVVDLENLITVTPFFVDNDFFSTYIGEKLLNKNFEGNYSLLASDVENVMIIPKLIAFELNYRIGDSVPVVNITHSVIYKGTIISLDTGSLENVTIAGTYDATFPEDYNFLILDQFVGNNVFFNLNVLNQRTMSGINEAMLKNGNFYVAAKIDESMFSGNSPTDLSYNIQRYVNDITVHQELKDIFVAGESLVQNLLIAFEVYSFFVTFLYVILAFPVVVLSIYLLNFGIRLSLEERRREIAIQKTQGAGGSSIFAQLRNDSILILFFGLIIGYFLGIVAAWSVSQATGFLKIGELNFSSFQQFLTLNIWAFGTPAVVLSGILAYSVYRSGKKFINQEIAQGVARQSWTKTGLIRKTSLDILLFLLGTSGLILVIFDAWRIDLGINLVMKVLIFVFSPILIWIGGASIGARLVKKVPVKLEGTFLRLPFLRDVKRIIKSGLQRRGDIDRLAVIITLTLSIATLSVIQGTTEESVEIRNIEWAIGSDYKVNYALTGSFQDNLSKIDGFEDAIGLGKVTINIASSQYQIVAYENERELAKLQQNDETIFWQEDSFPFSTPRSALERLESNNRGIFVPDYLLIETALNIGSNATFHVFEEDSRAGISHSVENLQILGLVQHLPGQVEDSIMVSEILYRQLLALIRGLNPANYENNPFEAKEYLVKLQDNVKTDLNKQSSINSLLSNMTSVSSYRSYWEEQSMINTRTSGYGISGLLNLNFVISLVASFISAFSFSTILIERRKQEFSILRAIGTTKWQIYKLTFGENTLMMITAIVWGAIIGVLISFLFNGFFEFFAEIIRISPSVPRLITFPFFELGIICIVALIGMLLATGLSVRSATNQDLSSATRVV